MPQPITQVDAFTDKPFAGNPAAVCLMDSPADATWMQNVAMEMNLSETAFVWPLGPDRLSLRWFTPAAEVDLCGHATLAAAHVLWEEGKLAIDQPARFETRSGLLTAKRAREWIELEFPALTSEIVQPPKGLVESLGAIATERIVAIGRSRFDYLIELDINQSELVALKPDLRMLVSVDARAMILTTRRVSDPRFDFVSRFFAPRVGVDEDPVTGSAHCALTPWWSARLQKSEMLAYQASRRGGVVRVRLQDDRVILGGKAVTVLRGNLIQGAHS